MKAAIIDSKTLSAQIKTDIAEKIKSYTDRAYRCPGLAIISVGNIDVSNIYATHKCKVCKELGIESFMYHLDTTITEKELVLLINSLNEDAAIDGIMLELPLPTHINLQPVVEAINPAKDVDGLHPYNLGRLVQQQPKLRPCTAFGIMQLLNYYEINVTGLHATIVGASNHVGRPIALELLTSHATVTICHNFTAKLAMHVTQADILISAIGKPGIIKSPWIKTGAIVIDVGTHISKQGHLEGDIDFVTASEIAGSITPVPGGVGPMTVVSLLQNVLISYESEITRIYGKA